MKVMGWIIGLVLSFASLADNNKDLSQEAIEAKIQQVNDAQNTMMLKGSTPADVEALFSFYTEDFTYIHEVYGGTYSRERLYNNSMKNVNTGRYQLTEPRYQIVQLIPGLNAAAVQRLEKQSGKTHLTIFEFKDDKVSKIIEYWQ